MRTYDEFAPRDCTFYIDMHLGAPHAEELDKLLIDIAHDEDAYILGDFMDTKNTLREKLEEAVRTFEAMISRMGGRYVTGNHEQSMCNLFHIVRGNLLIHGDFLYYSIKTFKKKRTAKRKGKSKIGWYASKVRRFFSPKNRGKKIPDSILAKAVVLAKQYDCHTIRFGHKHPSRILEYRVDGVTVVCYPKGINKDKM